MQEDKPVAGFSGQVDHLALWQRALSDDEIAGLSGGRQAIARRTLEILGPESPSLQYWRPRGYNAFVGDCMPFFHDGTFHFFYLFDRRHHQSKWATGAHQFGHATSRDLIHWQQHPLALGISDQTELSLGTGNCVFHEGKYYLYYIQHARRMPFTDARFLGDDVFVGTSTDGIHFQKQPEPWARLDYCTGGDINPLVFPATTGRRFYMYNPGIGRFLESDDLAHWKKTDAIDSLKDINAGCASGFAWNGWHYFSGGSTYWMSRTPPEHARWISPRPESQGLRDNLAVPEVAPFTGNRMILAGFRNDNTYASVAVFRELVQNADGTLGMKWPAEMVPPTAASLLLELRPLSGEVSGDASAAKLAAVQGKAAAALRDVPNDYLFRARVSPGAKVACFGLRLRSSGKLQKGVELRFEPSRRRFGLYCPQSAGYDRTASDVVGLDRPLELEVLVQGDCLDVCVDQRRTLAARLPAGAGAGLGLFALDGEVTFANIQVRPIITVYGVTAFRAFRTGSPGT
jgi:hypothetical protein